MWLLARRTIVEALNSGTCNMVAGYCSLESHRRGEADGAAGGTADAEAPPSPGWCHSDVMAMQLQQVYVILMKIQKVRDWRLRSENLDGSAGGVCVWVCCVFVSQLFRLFITWCFLELISSFRIQETWFCFVSGSLQFVCYLGPN